MKGILKGLATTMSTMTRKPVTIEYPDDRHVLPVRQRSFPVLTWDFDHDEPFCTGCMVCVRNCPVDCMTAVMRDNPKYATGESNRRKIIEKFWIDYGRCMRCNICVEVCNFEAIVMDNTWGGHEHASYDRRDLHMDIVDLLTPSKSGALPQPFHPWDELDANVAKVEGKELPAPRMLGARPEARAAQAARIESGGPIGIIERVVEAPKTVAKAAPAAGQGGGDEEILSESKIRAKRMRAEREAKAFRDRGEEVPQEILDAVAKYTAMKPGQAGGGAAAGAAVGGGGGTGELLTGTHPDGSMRFPPGVGDGPKGDPNSAEKVRARRMRAERNFKELTAKGEEIPADIAKVLFDTGSDLAPGGTIWATLVSAGGGGGGGAAAAPAAKLEFPPGIGIGPKGDPNSPEKVRARRTRAIRTAKAHLEKGEAIPDDIISTITTLGGEVPTSAS
ncbi:hypothetical protein AYO38_09065 [bacterium SCGC AG-212-C10]|nr:hypothetical protein AYO38_09065 [bacterium SCGC AG-212-C10]